MSDAPLRARHPIVLLHGAAGFATRRAGRFTIEYFRGVQALFERHGNRVHFWKVSNLDTVERRAAVILGHLRRLEKEGPFNLIGHSMGGLDGRCLISELGGADLVASLTCVATPHHGTVAAEWRNRAFAFAGLWPPRGPRALRFARHLEIFTREWAVRFNERNPPARHVRYRCWAAAAPLWGVCPLLQPSWLIVSRTEGPNDGLVSTASARLDDATFAGTIAADHLAQIGWKLGLNRFDSFDHLAFHEAILRDLVQAGL